MYVGFWACLAVLLVSMVRKETRLSPKGLMKSLSQGAKTGAQVGVTCAALGLVISSIVMAGLGVKLPIFIGNMFGQNLYLLLVMTAVVTIILGCGLPASAAYLLTVIAIAPVLTKMGIALLPAHFFVFFYANFSFITPPVAIAAMFGAKVAGANYLKTAIEAAKVGVAGFILPFAIIFCHALLFDFSEPVSSMLKLLALITALIVLQAGLVSYFLTNLNLLQKLYTIATAVVLLSYIFTDKLLLFLVGICLTLTFFLWQFMQSRKDNSLS